MCESESLKKVTIDGDNEHVVTHESMIQAVFSPVSEDHEDIRARYLKKRLKDFITRLVGTFSKKGHK
jgi:hypothetical protein